MTLFRRSKRVVPDMPPELTQHYNDEKRERAWAAWLLALVTMLITLALIVGLFLGGRWLYRKSRFSAKPAPVAVQTDKKTTAKPSDDKDSSSSAEATSETPKSTEDDKKTNDTTQSTPAGSPSDVPSPTTTPSTPTQQSQPTAQTPSDKLANTGPGDTLAIFLIVVALGYVTHQFILPVKQK